VPPPRTHQQTYHGVLAPSSSLRDDVVIAHPASRRARSPSPEATAGAATRPPHRYLWSELMRRVFGTDVLRCSTAVRGGASCHSSPSAPSSCASSRTSDSTPTRPPSSPLERRHNSSWGSEGRGPPTAKMEAAIVAPPGSSCATSTPTHPEPAPKLRIRAPPCGESA
jgi:hypothetical protein